jgi:hypothetical protein
MHSVAATRPPRKGNRVFLPVILLAMSMNTSNPMDVLRLSYCLAETRL